MTYSLSSFRCVAIMVGFVFWFALSWTLGDTSSDEGWFDKFLRRLNISFLVVSILFWRGALSVI